MVRAARREKKLKEQWQEMKAGRRTNGELGREAREIALVWVVVWALRWFLV